jgi:hypothetical protein
MFELTSRPCYMGQGTYPRATKLRDGSILGVYTAFENEENVIVTTYCSSIDDGLVWERLGEVSSKKQTQSTAGN